MQRIGDIAVLVDLRIELVQTVMFLTGMHEKTAQTSLRHEHTEAIEHWFAPYTKHPAVVLAAQLVNEGFTHGKPNRLALALGSLPELSEMVAVEWYGEIVGSGRKPGVSLLHEWIDSLRSFVQDSHFMEFVDARRSFYVAIEEHLASVLNPGLVHDLEDFYGESLGSYWLIGCPLYGNNGLLMPIPYPKSAYFIQQVPFRWLPRDVVMWPTEPLLTCSLWHEYGHCFVNQITYDNMDCINDLAALRRLHTSNFYKWWPAIVNETIVRACVARFIELQIDERFQDVRSEWGEDPCEADLRRNEELGFHLVRGMYTLLKQYEANRNEYPTFRDFYTVIIDWLRTEEEKIA